MPRLRGRRSYAELDEQSLEGTGCPERLQLSGELAHRVFALMAHLPEGQRQVLALVALEEFSYREVAATLDIPIGTVMSRLSRARRFLAERLHPPARPVETSQPRLRRVK